MCVRLGTAVPSVHVASGMGAPRFCAVHTPLGPRKSGIPMEVLMPAPVWTTMPPDSARLSRISSASVSILRWSSASSASWNSGVPSVPPTSSRHERRSAYPMEPAMVPSRRPPPRVARAFRGEAKYNCLRDCELSGCPTRPDLRELTGIKIWGVTRSTRFPQAAHAIGRRPAPPPRARRIRVASSTRGHPRIPA